MPDASHVSSCRRKGSNAALSLVHETQGGLDPAAAAVIAQLGRAGMGGRVSAPQARRHYSQNRASLLAPLQSVARITKLVPAEAGVQPLSFFYPTTIPLNSPAPALVFLHGGGWTLGDLDIYEPLVRALANATGSVVIWAHYRLAPENPYPAALEDVWKACAWVQANAEEFGIDPNRIGVGGDSAGGNLAAVTALAARDGSIQFKPAYQLLLYPCVDLTASYPSHEKFSEGYLLTGDLYAWYRHNYVKTGSAIDWRISPLFASSFADVAPAVVLYVGFDLLRDEASVYIKKLQTAGVPVETLFFPGQIHGFLNMGGAIPAAQVALARIGIAVKYMLRRSAREASPHILSLA